MIDLVAGYAKGYSASQLRPFLKSLRMSGYSGHILLFADRGGLQEAKKWDVEAIPCPPLRMKVHSDRFLCIRDVLKGRSYEGVLLSDTRDVLFQKNPALKLPYIGLSAYEEDARETIESCPYNSNWIRIGYGEDALKHLGSYPISCVGTVCGDFDSITKYLHKLCKEIETIQPLTGEPQDQAAHNVVIRGDTMTDVWANEEGEVYTVGYILPRNAVEIRDGAIVNRAGQVPTVIHQWDRHTKLQEYVAEII